MKMIKWMREHQGWFIAIIVTTLLLVGATLFLLIWFRDSIFTSSTLAIVVFVLLAFVLAGLSIFMAKVLEL